MVREGNQGTKHSKCMSRIFVLEGHRFYKHVATKLIRAVRRVSSCYSELAFCLCTTGDELIHQKRMQ